MKIDFMTLFPDMIKAAFSESIIARGVDAGYIDIKYHQIRDYSENKQRKVDDYPYGGGPGLIMAYQPIVDTYKHIVSELPEGKKPYCIYMSPQGTVLTQKVAKRLSKQENLVILCGHYEGVDERVIEEIVDEEISIGDYVMTGGELPACVLADCVARLVPGVLASEEATDSESHSDGLLEYPQYTRPAEINGRKVPDVLLSGNHQDIEKWRLQESRKRTKSKRPDLITDIYLDNSATTRQLPFVTEEMQRVSHYLYGNPSSLHNLGMNSEKELRGARKSFAEIIGADEKEIYFTSGGSESNNWAIRGVLEAYPRFKGKIIVSAGEHASVLETVAYLKKQGRQVDLLPLTKSGTPDLEALSKLVDSDTALVSVLHVNSETGAISDIAEIAKICKAANPEVILHADCVQSFGKIPVEPKKWGIDMISVSGHKIHGPRGTGFLYVRKGLKINPLIYGGGQESGLRSGTENVPAICGMKKAAEFMSSKMEENYSHVSELNAYVRNYISENIPKGVIVSDEKVSSPYVLNVAFPGIGAEVLLHSLETQEVYVSVGSACSSHKKNRSHVLMAMGYPIQTIDGAIRISFSCTNTMIEVKRGCEALQECVRVLYKRKRH
ncbi:MAG: tRNA (guanosine(37)-N1)-methyltransferase TrmD [Ruminococcaceae bacterium]|nr:tRNA (guanosine(37)-N1)-methyltransferase TrmD [Oscillospiraceae bacterium]